MNTPAHIIFATAAFARPHEPSRTWAAIAGALAPDLSLYLMAGVSLFLLGLDPSYVFDTLYFSDAWQQVFKIDNSVFLWGSLLLVGWRLKHPLLMILAASAMMHLALDFPLHHDDGRPHFWPLSDWVFQSPLSYWDRAHHAGIIGPIEMALSAFFCATLALRFTSFRSRCLIGGLAAFQLFPVFIWVVVFASDAV